MDPAEVGERKQHDLAREVKKQLHYEQMVRAASTLGGEREGKKQAVTGIPQRVLTTAEPQSRNPAVRLKHVGNLATLEKTP